MEKFGFSGLWKHIGTTVIAAALPVADALLTYLGAVEMPSWGHAIVGIAAMLLAAYKGKAAEPPRLAP